jgi:hypothetical protein
MIAEHRLLRETFRPGIDRAVGDRDVFCPVRHEPPHCIMTATTRSCATITGFALPGAMLKCDRNPMAGRVDHPELSAEVIGTGKRVPAA